MIRRNIVRADWDHRAVKWSLVAAAFALSVGCFAEVTLSRADEDTGSVVAERASDVEADRLERIAG
jgi:hypothetical protein